MAKKYLIVLIMVAVTLSGCTLKPNEPETSTKQTPAPSFRISEPSTVYIDIRGSEFVPLELNIVKGTTVKWRNFDSAQHAIFVDNVSSPPFDDRGSWSYTFKETGSFIYNCTIHTWSKNGRIIVK